MSLAPLAATPEIPSKIGPVHKRIQIKEQKEKEAAAIEEKFNLRPITASVLAARGFKADSTLENFLEPTLQKGLSDPKELKNLDKACKLIRSVVEANKSIAICCDFDVDGLSGGSQIAYFFNDIGVKSQVFVPCRFSEGYGLNEGTIRKIAEAGFSLVITVDFGTTNEKELALAKELGLKTIVIDHHHVGDHNPPCDVFINPQQEGCGFSDRILSAAGLAWYLVLGLRGTIKEAKEIDAREYLDLACLGTICDMVPLIGTNRVIAKRGLALLNSTKKVGLSALRNVMGAKRVLSCTDISFGIGPRINAAGRMVHGEIVIDLLTTRDQANAQQIAQKLDKLNRERQEAEEEVKLKAIGQFEKLTELPFALIACDPGFHTGVLGIVAQRLVENFYRPSIVMGIDEEGTYKGSARGIKGFSVIDSLTAVGKHLIKFGGHEGAGGFSVSERNLEKFSDAYQVECEKRLKNIETSPYVVADTEVALEDIDHGLVNELRKFSPCGMGNPNPQLLCRGVKVTNIKEIKGGHLKALFTDGKRYISGMLWRQSSHPALSYGATVDIVFRPDINSYMGQDEIQLNLQAIEETTP